jgi:precorrin-6Y C5,15-methyltransferase (decarboxylating)
MGDFLTCCDDVAAHSTPDAVFIGGHGGHLKEIMEKVLAVMSEDGIIVMNSVKAPKVTTDSHQLWDEACRELGLRQEPPLHIQLNDHHPITILRCKR